MQPPIRSLPRRALWTFVDQGLSSVSNAALSIVVARSVNPTAFGSFAIAVLVFTFVIGTSRAMITDPLVIRFSTADDHDHRGASGRAATAAMSLGTVTGLACVFAGLIAGIGGDLGAALICLGVLLPGLLVQDAWRYVFFSRGDPLRATIIDLTWAVVQFGIIAVLLFVGKGTMVTLMLSWGVGAVVAAVLGGILQKQRLSATGGLGWLRENRHLSWRLGADFVVNQGAGTTAVALVGPVSSVSAVGALSAARTLLGPLQLLFSGTTSFVLPVFAGSVASRRLRRQAALTSLCLVTAAGVWVLAMVQLPTEWGIWLLRENWAGAAAVIPALGWSMIMIAGAVGAGLGLKARSEAQLLLKVTLLQAPLLLGLGALGGWLNGAPGAALAFAAVQTLGFAITWWAFLSTDKRHVRD
ncbi:MAG TPA: hypothetical protein VES01_03500 [Dermatophilaceae bacterium]|nr:hypothetical protein [Dermatophilaceae bacterium]